MDAKIFYTILSIIGFFTVTGLTINAYFIREMLASLNQVKIQTAVLLEKTTSGESRISKCEREIEQARDRIHFLGNEINTIKAGGCEKNN